MIGVNTLSVLEKPSLRIVLAAVGNILIPTLFLATFVGPQVLYDWIIAASLDMKLLVAVGAIAYIVVWYLSILPYLSDFPWSHEIGDSNAKRFSELFFWARHFDEYSIHRYGMNANIYWPRLFLILPAGTKESLVQARSSYLSAGLLTCTCLWWFKFASPILCGMLIYNAICSSNERLFCTLAAISLIILYVNNEYFNVLLSFALRRFRVFVSLLLLFTEKLALLKLLSFIVLGVIAYQAFNAHLLGWQFQDWSTCWTPTNLGWLKTTALTLEAVALFFLTQALSRWFIIAGVTYGELTCAVFDLHRKELANSLGVNLPDDIYNEHHQWKKHEEFLKDGSILDVNRVSSPSRNRSSRNVFLQLCDEFTDDWNKVQDLLKKSSDLSDTPLTRLRKAVNETLAGIFLVFFCFFSHWIGCTYLIFHLPLIRLAESNSPVALQYCLTIALVTILPTLGLIVVVAFAICSLHYYVFKKKSPPIWMKDLLDDPNDQKNQPLLIGITLASYFLIKSRNFLPFILSVSIYWMLFALVASFLPGLITFRSFIAIPTAAFLLTASNMLLGSSLIYLARKISRVWQRYFKSSKSEQQSESKMNNTTKKVVSKHQVISPVETAGEIFDSEQVSRFEVQEHPNSTVRS